MNLEQAIRSRWAADQALNALLPVTRLTVGETSHPVLPYAKLRRGESKPWVRVNTGESFERTEASLDIHCATYDAARSVIDAIGVALEGSVESEGTRFHFVRRSETIRGENDGIYLGLIEFDACACPTVS